MTRPAVTARSSETGLGGESVRVVADGHQGRGGGVRADTALVQQFGCTGPPGQHGAGGGIGVQSVGPAATAPFCSVGPVDLDDLQPGLMQVTGQGRAEGVGAFDPARQGHPQSGLGWLARSG